MSWMAIKGNKNNEASFFRDRANDLRNLETILCAHFKGPEANFTSLLVAAKELDRIAESTNTPKTWGYCIRNLTLPLGTIRHIEPEPHDIVARICIDCEIESDIEVWRKNSMDPFVSYAFRLKVIGERGGIKYSWGIHLEKVSPKEKESNEWHPLYHMHFNGEPLEDLKKGKGFICMNTPRFVHYPLDIVLGVGFCLHSFYTKDQFNQLYYYNQCFSRLYKASQKRILEPYYLAISNAINKAQNSWIDCDSLCPQIVL